MTGFEVYKMYLALKLHFTTDRYDYFEFNGKVKASEKAFDKRKDAYFFKKFATKYDYDTALSYLVSNFVKEQCFYIKDLLSTNAEKNYLNWKKYNQSLVYNFTNEIDILLNEEATFEQLFECEKGKHPHIFKKYFANQISIETLVILNSCVRYLPTFDKVLSDPVWKELKNKILKYSPFLKLDIKKYKKIVLEKVNERIL
jgi:hypothetical protein